MKLVVFSAVLFSITFVNFCGVFDSKFFWDPDRLYKGVGVYLDMNCIEVTGPLTLKLYSEETGEVAVELDGISILKSVTENRSDELLDFMLNNLSGRKVRVSNPDYFDSEKLMRYLMESETPELLIWLEQENGEEVLWNLAMILNGYAQVSDNSNAMAPYIRVCGCQ